MRILESTGGNVGADVIVQLRHDIVDGRHAPGAKLKFADLQAAYGVGIGTLREALMTLVGEGIVTLDAGRGFRVAEVSEDDLRDLVAMRVTIERGAIEDSVTHGDDDWEGRVLMAWHKLSKVSRLPFQERFTPDHDFVKRHREFHYALVSACRSKRTLQFREMLYAQAERYRMLSIRHGGGQEDQHDRMRDAALARDATLAGDLLVQHITDSAQLVLKHAPQLKA